jgi:hypothetical protein
MTKEEIDKIMEMGMMPTTTGSNTIYTGSKGAGIIDQIQNATYPLTPNETYPQKRTTVTDTKKQAQLDLIERIQDDLISVLEGDEFDKEDIIDYIQRLKPFYYEDDEDGYKIHRQAVTGALVKDPNRTASLIPNI